MAGVTDLAFRLLCREAGAGMVCTEMISDQSLLGRSRRSRAMIGISPYESPVSCQLCGSNPETMAAAATLVAAAGADVVDINMGCPAPKIVSNNEGASLMRQPDRAVAIVAAVRAALPDGIPLTAKIRAGWDHASVNAVEFAQALVEAGVDGITVHGRVRSQFYSGQADWSIIAAVRDAVPVPVTGNGDVRTGRDAVAMLARTGCDMVMIGRGALGNPGLFRECLDAWAGGAASPEAEAGGGPDARRAAEAPDPYDVARRHLRASLALKGSWHGLVEMRKHGAWYLAGRRGAAKTRQRLMRAGSLAEMEECLKQALRPEETV
jgi:nifR3 family TIM-barrel protein